MIVALILAVAVTVLLGAALTVPRSPVRLFSPIGKVRPGAFAAMVHDVPAIDGELTRDLEAAFRKLEEAPAELSSGPQPNREDPDQPPVHGGTSADATVPAALAGAVGANQWLHPDPHVLDAVAQATHHQVANSLDLWHEVNEHHYHLWTKSSLVNWRGHVGEQQVFDQLHSWLGDQVQIEALSNHPGSDLSIANQDFNVKVTADYNSVGPEHFAQYPSTPIIINADAVHIPADALHLDLSQPFDPAMLDGHAIVVAEGLHLSGIEDSLGASFGDFIGGHLDAADLMSSLQDAGIPVLGSAIRVVRSGIRENKLRGVHGDNGRMIKNIAADVTIVGTGVATGTMIGHIAGSVVDVGTLGATGGLATVVGGMIGAGLGGYIGNRAATDVRMQSFRTAQKQARDALEVYDASLERVTATTQTTWEKEITRAEQRSNAAAAKLRIAFDEVATRARAAFHSDDILGPESARREMIAAGRRVELALRSERSIRARRRASKWKLAASQETDPERLFDLVLAAPDGRRTIRDLLNRVQYQRQLAVASVTEAARITAVRAAQIRGEEALRLGVVRTRLHSEAKELMAKPLATVEAANSHVIGEARAAGLIAADESDMQFPVEPPLVAEELEFFPDPDGWTEEEIAQVALLLDPGEVLLGLGYFEPGEALMVTDQRLVTLSQRRTFEVTGVVDVDDVTELGVSKWWGHWYVEYWEGPTSVLEFAVGSTWACDEEDAFEHAHAVLEWVRELQEGYASRELAIGEAAEPLALP